MTEGFWWQKEPGRLDREEEALQVIGIPFERDENAFLNGHARYGVTVSGPDGLPVDLIATYPDVFPYFKPMVTGPDLGFAHHYNPFTQEMCMMSSGRGVWMPSDTLAKLLTEQWPKLIEANSGVGRDENGALLEVVQAEPATIYSNFEANQLIALVGAVQLPSGVTSGDAQVIILREDPEMLGVVMSLTASGLRSFYDRPLMYLGERPCIKARWVRVPEFHLADFTADALWRAALAVDAKLSDRHWSSVSKAGVLPSKTAFHGPSIQIVLIAVPEEVRHRELGVGWIALRRDRATQGGRPSQSRVLRVSRAGPADLLVRAPELAPLSTKRVLVVGAGGLGSSLIAELGRVGLAELNIIDGDFVDVAAAVRFPSAFRFAGMSKAHALTTLISEGNPYTKVTGFEFQIGVVSLAGRNQREVLAEQIDNADLVVDATADVSVQHLLSDLAREQKTTYMHAEGTPGVWGGLVGLFSAKHETCWMCVQHHLTDGSLPQLPAATAPDVQPAGCAEPTYTGTGFDLGVIATQAVRIAVSHLSGAEGYDCLPGNVYTVSLRDDQGLPTAPIWTTHVLDRHPECGNHR